MDELQKRGGKLLYDPEFVVARRPRPNLKAFARMLMTYGRGRAEQFRLHPTLGSALNFVPPLFLLYVIGMVCAFAFAPAIGRLLVIPLGLYALAVLGQVLVLATNAPIGRSIAAAPLIFLTHLLYGFGFWRGLFTRLKAPTERSPVPVEMEEIEVGQAKSL
jgi:hypothetical protein